jgi:biopolymer transport protein ExbD
MAFSVGNGRDGEAPFSVRKKRANDDEIDITPMIDIVFLLLIFFVVSSKMDPTKTGAFPVAERGVSVSSKDSAIIFMERGSGEKALLKKVDGSPFIDDEEQQRVDIVDYVTQQLDVGKTEVMILGDRTVSVGEVARVQRIIGDGFDGMKTTYIAVKEE